MIDFDRRKQDILKKRDKSSIGEIDSKIRKLCDKINNMKDYYTLSSCSGRIVLIKNSEEKKHSLFLFRSHDKLRISEFRREVKNVLRRKINEGILFKQEPCILHMASRDINNANKFLIMARDSGWKNSGIIAVSGNRVVLELRSTEKLELPLIVNGKLLVDDDYLEKLVIDGNKGLKRSWEKIRKLSCKL